MLVASVEKKSTRSDADVNLPEDARSALIQHQQRLAHAASQAKPPVSHASYIDFKQKSEWADRQLYGYENSLKQACTDLAEAAREATRLCGLLGIPATCGKVYCMFADFPPLYGATLVMYPQTCTV